MGRTYIAIDLKSFYASAECRDLGLDPLDAALVVADRSRSEKTICLAVSPALKAYGIPGRCRLFEVTERVKEVNAERQRKAPGRRFTGKSTSAAELSADPSLALDFIAAVPRMAHYIEVSSAIYRIYLRHISPDDIHVYSIDEVFIDATDYLTIYRLSAHDFAMKLILEVLEETGITATAGIGENMYLAKVAMDIVAKHIPADGNGVRIAELDEMEYRRKLWTHRPITDFWRVGRGYARKLEEKRIFTMGDVARCSVENEEVLYRLFGVNAELLIDHAWGWEPCTMKDIKAYRPESNSLGSGQVLQEPYSAEKARLVLLEMADSLSFQLIGKALATDQIAIYAGYDSVNMNNGFKGSTKTDFYGRTVPKSVHQTMKLDSYTSSSKAIMEAAVKLFDASVDRSLLIRRLGVTALNVISERDIPETAEDGPDLFTAPDAYEKARKKAEELGKKERMLQEAALTIKRKFGGNAILRGMSYEKGATQRERNGMIGGHKA